MSEYIFVTNIFEYSNIFVTLWYITLGRIIIVKSIQNFRNCQNCRRRKKLFFWHCKNCSKMTKLWFVVNLILSQFTIFSDTKCLLFTFLEGDIVQPGLSGKITIATTKPDIALHKSDFVYFLAYLKIGPLDSIKILYSILTVRSEDSRLLIFLFMSDWFIERLDMWTYKRSYITNHISGIFNSLLNLSALYQSFHTNHVLKCN